MKTIKEQEKVLVRYIREKTQYDARVCYNKQGKPYPYLVEIKGEIIGCVLSTAKGVVGWSLLNPKDRIWYNYQWDLKSMSEQKAFLAKNKELAYHIAYQRAVYMETLPNKDLEAYYFSKTPDSLLEEIDKMIERSEKYFK